MPAAKDGAVCKALEPNQLLPDGAHDQIDQAALRLWAEMPGVEAGHSATGHEFAKLRRIEESTVR